MQGHDLMRNLIGLAKQVWVLALETDELCHLQTDWRRVGEERSR